LLKLLLNQKLKLTNTKVLKQQKKLLKLKILKSIQNSKASETETAEWLLLKTELQKSVIQLTSTLKVS